MVTLELLPEPELGEGAPPPPEGAEVEGAAPVELPASEGFLRTGPVGSPEATVTAETAARRACCVRWGRGG